MAPAPWLTTLALAGARVAAARARLHSGPSLWRDTIRFDDTFSLMHVTSIDWEKEIAETIGSTTPWIYADGRAGPAKWGSPWQDPISDGPIDASAEIEVGRGLRGEHLLELEPLDVPSAAHTPHRQAPLPKAAERALEAVPTPLVGGVSQMLSFASTGADAAASQAEQLMPQLWWAPANVSAAAAAHLNVLTTTVAMVGNVRQSPVTKADRLVDSPGTQNFFKEVARANRSLGNVNVGSARSTNSRQARKLRYVVDTNDSTLKHAFSGLAYRLSKDVKDRDHSVKPAAWGSIVEGIDEGEGWLKIGDHYLPTTVQNNGSVLVFVRAVGLEKEGKAAMDATEAQVVELRSLFAPEVGRATCVFAGSSGDQLQSYLDCLVERCEDWDPAIAKGISCDGTFLPLGCGTDIGMAFHGAPEGDFVYRTCPARCGRCRRLAPEFNTSPPAESNLANRAAGSPTNASSMRPWVPDHPSTVDRLQEAISDVVKASLAPATQVAAAHSRGETPQAAPAPSGKDKPSPTIQDIFRGFLRGG